MATAKATILVKRESDVQRDDVGLARTTAVVCSQLVRYMLDYKYLNDVRLLFSEPSRIKVLEANLQRTSRVIMHFVVSFEVT